MAPHVGRAERGNTMVDSIRLVLFIFFVAGQSRDSTTLPDDSGVVWVARDMVCISSNSCVTLFLSLSTGTWRGTKLSAVSTARATGYYYTFTFMCVVCILFSTGAAEDKRSSEIGLACCTGRVPVKASAFSPPGVPPLLP